MRQRIVQAQKPRSQVAIASDWFRVRYHDAAGSAVIAYDGKLSGAAVSDTIALSGTTANVFNDRGFATPIQTTGNGAIIDADANIPLETFLRADTLGANGGILIFGVVKFNGTPANATERVFGYGSLSAARGGYTINVVTGANKNIQVQMYNLGGSLVTASRLITNAAGAESKFMAYIEADAISMSSNGNWAAHERQVLAANPHRGLLNSQDGIGFLCQSDFAGTTPSNALNSNHTTGNEYAHHGLLFVRNEGGFTQTELTALAAEHANNPREIPWGLDGK